MRPRHPVRFGILVALGALASLPSAAVAVVQETSLHLPGAQPTGIVSGPDGNLWLSLAGSDRIERVTPAGTRTEFTLPAGRQPTGIASAGGQIWFAETLGDRVGRLNPLAGSDSAIQSSITEFAISGAGSRPTGIAAGADGNVWVTEAGGDQIARVTAGGAVSEFTVAGAGSAPTGIAAGADGALWFTEAGSAQVGRITTAGLLSNEFTVPGLPGIASVPADITAGPDGALWFVDSGLDHVRRITTGGALSSFAAPAGSGLSGIAAGPDGNLWATAGRAGQILRITPTGDIARYSLPASGAGPVGITTGSDGALWFAEKLADAVGHITTDTPPDVLPLGPPGPAGAPGPAGLPGATGPAARVVLVAYQASPQKPRTGRRVTVRFAITGAASITLSVRRIGQRLERRVATRQVRNAGLYTLGWSGKLAGKKARRGTYELVVRATSAGRTVRSSLRVRVR